MAKRGGAHSHSIVAGGLLLMSYTTRLTPATWLMMRVEIFANIQATLKSAGAGFGNIVEFTT